LIRTMKRRPAHLRLYSSELLLQLLSRHGLKA
jgi:hypothetical protein